MTDAISRYAQSVQLDRYARQSSDKSAEADSPLAAGETVSSSLASSKPVVSAAPVAVVDRSSEALNLSKIIERAKQEPDFDRAKVDAIRESIKNGQYPLNVDRIAESFMAIEQLIGQ